MKNRIIIFAVCLFMLIPVYYEWEYSQSRVEYQSMVHDKYEDQSRSGRWFKVLVDRPNEKRSYINITHGKYQSLKIGKYSIFSERRLDLNGWLAAWVLFDSIVITGIIFSFGGVISHITQYIKETK